jgi:large conductance mechanosensitive channel
MSWISEFKTFAMRGNVVDLAVGVVIGGAFGKIVTSLVDHVIMPPIGFLTGGIDFSSWVIPLRAAVDDKPEVAIKIGLFLNTIVQFTIVAFAIFMLIKGLNSIKKKEDAAAPAKPTAEVELLREIRDLLKTRN